MPCWIGGSSISGSSNPSPNPGEEGVEVVVGEGPMTGGEIEMDGALRFFVILFSSCAGEMC